MMLRRAAKFTRTDQGEAWITANRAYLNLAMERLRLAVRRRVLWLRQVSKNDPLREYQTRTISEGEIDRLLQGECPEEESEFYRLDPDAGASSDALDELGERMAAHADWMRDGGSWPALIELGLSTGLTAFERWVLVLCLAPELDPAYERLYAYLHNDLNRRYPSLHHADALFGQEDNRGRTTQESFFPGEPLRRYCLVEIETQAGQVLPTASCPLRLPERVVHFLLGVNRLDDRLSALLRPVEEAPLTARQTATARRLAAWLRREPGGKPWPVVNLTGPPGSGKSALARRICSELGLELLEVNRRRLALEATERLNWAPGLEREAVLLGAAFYVDLSDAMEQDKGNPMAERELMERHAGMVIVASRHPNALSRKSLVVEMAQPTAAEQRELWEKALYGKGEFLRQPIAAVVEHFDLGPQAIQRAAMLARSQASLRLPGAMPTAEELWLGCRQLSGWKLEDLGQRISPCYSWEDIVLPAKLKGLLREMANQVAQRVKVYQVWGFGARLSRGRGISALFAGASGTGKTMAAEILAAHLKLDLYRVDLSGVVSKYIGETERNLRRVFEAAEQSGAILFFDEADALFGHRTEVRDSHDRYANIEVSYLLQKMEDYRGLAILATNRKSALDRAFLRRIRFHMDFPFPDAVDRRRIWAKMFPPEAAIGELDFDALARLEVAGGNIKTMALNAAFLAAGKCEAIGMKHVIEAARWEYAKCDKAVTETEFGPYFGLVRS